MPYVTIERETLQAVLDAMQYMHDEKVDYMVRNNLGNPYKETATKLAVNAIKALRAALAQQAEPVAIVRSKFSAIATAQPTPAAVPPLVFNACNELEAEIDAGWSPAARMAVRRLRAGLNMIAAAGEKP